MITITEIEAWQLAQLVEAMEPTRRAAVHARFNFTCELLARHDMLEPLKHPEIISETDRLTLTFKYISMGIACPFLENESCSIYTDRPMGLSGASCDLTG